MNDPLKIITEDLRNTATTIKKETDTLRSDTDKKIGQIDDTGKALPSEMYNTLLPLLTDVKAFLGRSMDIRDRISMVLGEVAKAVETEEKKIEKDFKQLQDQLPQTQSSNSGQNQNNPSDKNPKNKPR